MAKDDAYIQLRKGLMEHLELGLMKGKDLSTYVSLHFYADYTCGIAWKVCAPFIGRFLNENTRKIQDSLLSLEKAGYIKRLNHRGQVSYYPIIIDKYKTSLGYVTRIDKMVNKKELAFESELKVYLNGIKEELKPNLNGFYYVPIKDIKDIKTIVCSEVKKPQEPKNGCIDSTGTAEEYILKVTEWLKINGVNKRLEWSKDYPELDVRKEMNKGFLWLKGNTKKRRKDLIKFFTGWLLKAKTAIDTRNNINEV